MKDNVLLRKMLHRDEFIMPFDRLFDEMCKNTFPNFTKAFGINFFGRGSYPKCDVKSTKDSIIITAAVPGLPKKDVVINFNPEGRILSIISERKANKLNNEEFFIYRELKQSSFRRSFELSHNLDEKDIKAVLTKGILVITIPKKVGDNPAQDTIDIPVETVSI